METANASPNTSSPLFRGLKFFLTRTLSGDVADEVQELVERHGGVVSSSPAGATQLVDFEKLDSRRPEWVSADYVKDSAASGALQDPAKYSGVVFSSRPAQLRLKGRVRYSVEDDVRLLHFAKLRGWTSTNSVPASAWKVAESGRVTSHPWKSMHEHFRKQLQNKTPLEQRAIMARASEFIQVRLQRQEAEEEEEKERDCARTSPSCAQPSTPGRQGAVAPEPTTPVSTGTVSAPEAPPTPATGSPSPRRHIAERTRQKRKRRSRASVIAESSPATREDEEKDNENNDDEGAGAHVVFFRSVWTELAADPSKRARLQAFFRASMAGNVHQTEASTTESVASASSGSEAPTEILAREGSNNYRNGEPQHTMEVGVQRATDPETNQIICQLQLEMNQETPCVVHALYYCSGDMDMARAFLKGSSPSGMWSPEDDLLLVNLVVDENIDRSAVDAAVARGDFASMQSPRETDAILDRVQFLR